MKTFPLIASILWVGACDPGHAIDPGVDAVGPPLDASCPTWYQDFDGDHHGNPSMTRASCTPPAGYVASHDDCNDADPMVNPLAAEVCDQLDNDCDPNTVETCPSGCQVTVRPDGTGHRYLLCTSHATWIAARDVCAGNGYRLARIDDVAEDLYVRDSGGGQFGGSDRWWLGGTDSLNEGDWLWPDGARFWPIAGLYVHWWTGQPDGGVDDCLSQAGPEGPASGAWFDDSCAATYPFVCERY